MYILFVFFSLSHILSEQFNEGWLIWTSVKRMEHIRYPRKFPWAPSFTVNSYALPQAATVLPVYRTSYIENDIIQCALLCA